MTQNKNAYFLQFTLCFCSWLFRGQFPRWHRYNNLWRRKKKTMITSVFQYKATPLKKFSKFFSSDLLLLFFHVHGRSLKETNSSWCCPCQEENSRLNNNSIKGVRGCRDGAVVRALASHQCGPGSIPGLGVICGLSLLVLYSAPRGFLRALRFPLSSKTNIWLDLLSLFISVYSVPN